MQVLSEFTVVARRKLEIPWRPIDDVVETLLSVCTVEPLTVVTYRNARRFAERYRMPWYDALIAASALLAGCTTLYSENFQHGQSIDGKLKVVNPFMQVR